MPCKKNPGNGLADELLLLYRQVGFDPDQPIELMREMGYEPPQVRTAIETLKEQGTLEPIEIEWLESALNLKTDVLVMNPEAEENPGRLTEPEMAVKRFWDGKKNYKSPFLKGISPTGGYREGRRDRARHEDYGAISKYILWDSIIAQLNRREDDDGNWTLWMGDAGWPTITTHDRMNNILAEGKRRYRGLNKYGHFSRDKGQTVFYRKVKDDFKKIPMEHGAITLRFKGEKFIATPAVVDTSMEEVGPIKAQHPSLQVVEDKIDAIEMEMARYSARHPEEGSDPRRLAVIINKSEEYDNLLRERFMVERKTEKGRGGPKW